MRRSPALRFMGGWHAFPGGRLAEADAAVPACGSMDGLEAYERSGPPAAHAACALRELFEEAGILVASGTLPSDKELDRARRLLLDDGLDFAGWLGDHGLALDASRLCFAGRWVTPPLSPIRFDATFFLLEWPVSSRPQPSVIPGELESGEWIPAGRALERWDAGNVHLAQPTLATLRVLDEEGPAGRQQLWQSQAHHPDAPSPIEFRPGIRAIPLAARTLPPATHTNALLVGNREFVLIDPGSSREDELRQLREIVDAECRRSGGSLRGIWLSHHHRDHVEGAQPLRQHYGVPVGAHDATAARLAESGIRVDTILRDGASVELDGSPPVRLRILLTPGHASGHLCFFEERTKTLLCGDMLSAHGTVVISPPDGSMSQYIASLERLEQLDAKVILPSHGTMFRDPATALREAIRHRLWREDQVLAAWEEGARELEDLIDSVYEDLDPAARPIAVRQVLAHLERLEESGRIPQLPAATRTAIGCGP